MEINLTDVYDELVVASSNLGQEYEFNPRNVYLRNETVELTGGFTDPGKIYNVTLKSPLPKSADYNKISDLFEHYSNSDSLRLAFRLPDEFTMFELGFSKRGNRYVVYLDNRLQTLPGHSEEMLSLGSLALDELNITYKRIDDKLKLEQTFQTDKKRFASDLLEITDTLRKAYPEVRTVVSSFNDNYSLEVKSWPEEEKDANKNYYDLRFSVKNDQKLPINVDLVTTPLLDISDMGLDLSGDWDLSDSVEEGTNW